MEFKEAMKIIGGKKLGYMVSFEEKDGCVLKSDHFPDIFAGEELIQSEEDAWTLARLFSKNTRGKMINIRVIDQDFNPVNGCEKRKIENI